MPKRPISLEAREWMKKGEVTGILHPFRLRDACSARRDFRIHPVCRHGRIPQLQGITRSKLARDVCRNDAHRRAGTIFLPPQGLLAVASSAPSAYRERPFANNYTEGYGLPDSRRNDCHHLPDNADGDCRLPAKKAEQRRKGIYSMKARSERYAVHRIGEEPSYM